MPRLYLTQSLSTLGLIVTDEQVSQLMAYQELIQKWNTIYNLTAIRDPADILTHHLLDSLAVIQPLQRQLALLTVDASEPPDILKVSSGKLNYSQSNPTRLLDVGSGAGLPGVVIAICCPDIKVDCIDKVAKKTAFIQQVAAHLKLSNLRALHNNVEKLTDKYSVICSRAFASLANFTAMSGQLLLEGAVWMAMKGKYPSDEIAALPAGVNMFYSEQLQVPGLDADRCLVWMKSP